MSNDMRDVSVSPECKDLETLLVQNNPKLERLSETFFQFMYCLKVLDPETSDHLLANCSYTKQVWHSVDQMTGNASFLPAPGSSMMDWWLLRRRSFHGARKKGIDLLAHLERAKQSCLQQRSTTDAATTSSSSRGGSGALVHGRGALLV